MCYKQYSIGSCIIIFGTLLEQIYQLTLYPFLFYVLIYIYIYISSVYGPFSDRVGLPLHNNPSSVLMKSIRAEFLRPKALPGVNHMRGMQYKIQNLFLTLVLLIFF